MPVDVGESAVDAVVTECEAGVVDPHQVQDRGVQVVAIRLTDGRLPGPGVAFAVGRASIDPGAGQPCNRGATVVVASGGALGERLAAELGAEEDQCILEQAAGLEVAQQTLPPDGQPSGRWTEAPSGCWYGCPNCSTVLRLRSRPGRTAPRAPPVGGRADSRRPKSVVAGSSSP